MMSQTAERAKLLLPKIELDQVDWGYFAIRLLAVAAAVFVLTYRLSGLTYHRFSLPEQTTLASSRSLHALLANPLYLPYQVVEWLVLRLGGASHIFAIRLVAAFFALITLWLFLSIARRWFNRTTYILAAVLFATSLWFLHFGRLAVPTILLTLMPLVIIRLTIWLRDMKKEQAESGYHLVVILPITFALTLYVPGAWLIWLIIIVWQWRKLALLLRRVPWRLMMAGSALAAVLVVPLIYGLANDPHLIYAWAGVQKADWLSFERLRLIYQLPLHYLAYGPAAPVAQWLGRQPILDAFSAAMALVGLGFYIWNFKLRQAKLLIFLLIIGLVLYVASDGTLDEWIGPVYLLAAAGIGYLLKIWRGVFPKNPFAYGTAIVLLALLTAISVFYTTRSYYVAWHYHPATKTAFSIKL